MIGVNVDPEERAAAEEFFQIFKTPWEFAREGILYSALVSTTENRSAFNAKVYIEYNSESLLEPISSAGQRSKPFPPSSYIHYKGYRIGLRTPAICFLDSGLRWALLDGKEPIVACQWQGTSKVFSVGYRLFAEADRLLRSGQPIEESETPSLDLHVDILRTIIIGAGLPLSEIPPIPLGHSFIVSLSHDIDHPVMRNHRFDKTMAGFIYRATLGTLSDVLKKRRPLGDLTKNFWAVVSLPLVHAGLLPDPWLKFDRFLEIERDLGSTYFVIPVANDPGQNPHEAVPAVRASSYELPQIAAPLERITHAGAEVGLHGLNAWLDEKSAQHELSLVTPYAPQAEYGVRMHWLYFDQNSPQKLEKAGLRYDSSVGYNETIGFRAGTNQVYRPFGANKLLELPLLIMDTAMFFAGFLNLSHSDAMTRIDRIVDHARKFGGVVTVNWHDRSLFAERHWEAFYVDLIERLKNHKPWFPTAASAVEWFRIRRETIFLNCETESGVKAQLPKRAAELPGVFIRTHRSRTNSWSETLFDLDNIEVVDHPLDPNMDLNVVV